eukprot:6021422-Ditylum_brightwellii.AAC.1
MLYCKCILESMGLKVELPMVLYIDNSGAVNLASNWSAGGLTRHMETRIVDNPVDIFTKNLAGPACNKCAKFFVGKDSYNKERLLKVLSSSVENTRHAWPVKQEARECVEVQEYVQYCACT